MNLKRKSGSMGIIFLGVLFVGGLLLTYKGNDAIVLAVEKKDGILTAEQVKVSFDSVGGRLVNEAVKESQEIKKGDVLMELDSTDVDLSIDKMKTQIAQVDAQIKSKGGSIDNGYTKADTDEKQTHRQIDQQKAAVSAASATYQNKLLDYNRKVALVASGAVAQSELDAAQMNLDVSAADAAQQQQLLKKLLAGADDKTNTDSIALPTIIEQRQELSNEQNDVENLIQQKKTLEIQLKELLVKKDRLTLRAPEDGKILKIIAKKGEMISANTPVILIESKRYYYDIYLNEQQAANLHEEDTITGHSIAGNLAAAGTVRFITAAPGFADLKMSREKSQADLSAFQVRIYVEVQDGLLPGMTIEVNKDEFTKR
ncbi:HlyD family secretion protein [Propionispira raffinosivorans]|uniref:HlyD family secretion protein n=1 Tax=Propionispira raffinosivorans TaxID=86959 RepID=UPI000364B1A9|nr:HlyD family efflux transporter periplasmic adaptor subunit [Propionispira raffinosivorans]